MKRRLPGGTARSPWLMSRVAGSWMVQDTELRCRYGGREPGRMSSLARPAGPVHVGMDVSKNTIMAAVLWPGDEVPVTDWVFNDEPSVRARSELH